MVRSRLVRLAEVAASLVLLAGCAGVQAIGRCQSDLNVSWAPSSCIDAVQDPSNRSVVTALGDEACARARLGTSDSAVGDAECEVTRAKAEKGAWLAIERAASAGTQPQLVLDDLVPDLPKTPPASIADAPVAASQTPRASASFATSATSPSPSASTEPDQVAIPPSCARLLGLADPIGRIRAINNRLSKVANTYLKLIGQSSAVSERRDFALGVAESAHEDATAAAQVGQPAMAENSSDVARLEEAKAANSRAQMNSIDKQLRRTQTASDAEQVWSFDIISISVNGGVPDQPHDPTDPGKQTDHIAKLTRTVLKKSIRITVRAKSKRSVLLVRSRDNIG